MSVFGIFMCLFSVLLLLESYPLNDPSQPKFISQMVMRCECAIFAANYSLCIGHIIAENLESIM